MDIRTYVAQEKEKMKCYVEQLKIKPHLVIVQLNEDEASNSYVRGKLKDCAEIGIAAELIKIPVDTTEKELLSLIEKINNDTNIHGVIVQMPLPSQINEDHIKTAILPSKDVDGFHPMSLLKPCTPKGIIDYLMHEKITFQDKNAVVIGRSNIVGKPLAKMLTDLNCNTTILHSKTSKENMDKYLANADQIYVAVGKRWFIDGSNIKKDAVIVDVGINRFEGKLYGDVKPDLDVKLQTPVPGGVGLLTRLTLMKNLLEAYNNAISHN